MGSPGWYGCPVCKEKLWIAIAKEFKENKVVFTVDFICKHCGSALIVSNNTGRVLLRPKGGSMPEPKKVKKAKSKKEKKSDLGPSTVAPMTNSGTDAEPPKEKVKVTEVHCCDALCRKCMKKAIVYFKEGMYSITLGQKTMSGKETNPDIPCPYCNARIPMPKYEENKEA